MKLTDEDIVLIYALRNKDTKLPTIITATSLKMTHSLQFPALNLRLGENFHLFDNPDFHIDWL